MAGVGGEDCRFTGGGSGGGREYVCDGKPLVVERYGLAGL